MERSAEWTRENLAWLAGLLEGEGSFHLRRRSDRRTGIALVLAMTDRDVVERAAAIGGLGSRVLIKPAQKSHHKDQWVWRVQAGHEVVALMWAIYPWLGHRRREQVALAIQTWRTNGGKTFGRTPFQAA